MQAQTTETEKAMRDAWNDADGGADNGAAGRRGAVSQNKYKKTEELYQNE